MALETNITQRDKKLLIFLAIFIVVAGFSYLVIKPTIDEIMDTNLEIEKGKTEKAKVEYSIKMVPQLQQEIAEMKCELKLSDSILYRKLRAQQVDNLITSLVINYGFNRNDIRNLEMKYPDSYTTMYNYQEEETAEVAQSSDQSNQENDKSLAGILCAAVKFSIYGKRDQIQPVINHIASDYHAIRITSLFWQADNVNEGYYTTTIEMNVYMTDNEE